MAALPLAALPQASQAQVSVGVSINLAPPPLPVYAQPAIPAPGYLWTPGYWAWGPYGYYWVPGTWVAPPAPGLLWTPGYWGWSGGAFFWHAGYWGPQIGFYGGVNYGFGYVGHGYLGGEWRGGTFVYNRAVTNVTNVNVTNVYNQTVVNNVTVNHTSFNGGPGGIAARPNPAEMAAAREHHVAFTPMQRQQEQLAARNPALRASANGGRPPIAATARPGVFSGHGVVAARAAGGPVHAGPAHAGPAHAHAGPAHAAPGHPGEAHAQARPGVEGHGGRPPQVAASNEHRASPAEHRPAPQSHGRPQESHAAPHGAHGPSRPDKEKEHER
ncbi:MAG TPA: YXWGXW repeat-containing protein [Steroidobacteraceae bacterium]|nr:YXWGXW repeat-containing protein [Steroidobacteraceae bacterium]